MLCDSDYNFVHSYYLFTLWNVGIHLAEDDQKMTRDIRNTQSGYFNRVEPISTCRVERLPLPKNNYTNGKTNRR